MKFMKMLFKLFLKKKKKVNDLSPKGVSSSYFPTDWKLKESFDYWEKHKFDESKFKNYE